MSSYLDITKLKNLVLIPSSYVDEVELGAPGYVQGQLDYWARWIDSKLAKRYVVPFAAHDATPATPVAVQGWLARLIAPRLMLKRGVDQNDLQFETILEDARDAKTEIDEASDAVDGLYDLPLLSTASSGGITKGGPLGYSETSPYVWADSQAEVGRFEDSHGYGSGDA